MPPNVFCSCCNALKNPSAETVRNSDSSAVLTSISFGDAVPNKFCSSNLISAVESVSPFKFDLIGNFSSNLFAPEVKSGVTLTAVLRSLAES